MQDGQKMISWRKFLSGMARIFDFGNSIDYGEFETDDSTALHLDFESIGDDLRSVGIGSHSDPMVESNRSARTDGANTMMLTDFIEEASFEKATFVEGEEPKNSTAYAETSSDTVLVYSDEDKVQINVDVQKMKDRETRRKIQAMLGK